MKFKRGDTFSFVGSAIVVVNGVPSSDFTGWTARSHLRTAKGRLVDTMAFTWLNAATGTFTLEATTDTKLWPLEQLAFDIEFTSPNEEIVSTDTAKFNVLEDITR